MGTRQRPSGEERALRKQLDAFFLRVPDPSPSHWQRQQQQQPVKFYKGYDSVDDNEEIQQPYREVTMVPDRSPRRHIYRVPVDSPRPTPSTSPTKVYQAKPAPAVDPWLAKFPKPYNSAWSDLLLSEKIKVVGWNICGRSVLILVFMFLVSLASEAIGLSMVIMLGPAADSLLQNEHISQNPVGAMMTGVISGALALDTVWPFRFLSAYANYNVPSASHAFYVLMGLHIGSSITPMLAAVVFITNQQKIKRAIGGALIQYSYFTLAVLVLLPLEVIVGMLYYVSWSILDPFVRDQRLGGYYFLRCVTSSILEEIVQVDFIPSSRWSDSTASWRVIKVTCPTQTEVVINRPCSYLFRGLADKWNDDIIGFIIFAVSLIILFVCYFVLYKLLYSMASGRTAIVLQSWLTNKGSWFGELFIFLTFATVTLFLQNIPVITCVLVVLMGGGLFGRRRLFTAISGASLGYSLGLFSISLSLTQPASAELGLAYVFMNILGFLFWHPVPYMRKCVKGIGTYVGNSTATYRWLVVPLPVLLFFILPLIFLGLTMGGIICFSVISAIILLVVVLLILINILQRTKPLALPAKLRQWDNIPPWTHTLKPYANAICTAKRTVKVKKKRKAKKTKGDPAKFWENSRVYLYEWDVPSNSSRCTDIPSNSSRYMSYCSTDTMLKHSV